MYLFIFLHDWTWISEGAVVEKLSMREFLDEKEEKKKSKTRKMFAIKIKTKGFLNLKYKKQKIK